MRPALKINAITAIFDIGNGIVLLFSMFLILIFGFVNPNAALVFQWIVVFLELIGLGFNGYALYQNKKAGLPLMGCLLGIFGCIFPILSNGFSVIGIFLMALAVIYLFGNKPTEIFKNNK